MGDRTKKSFLNIGSNLFIMIIKTILTFVTRTIFIYCLGEEALGLNGLFTNILSMLSLAELGVSTAINFSLYEPIAKNDNKKISKLMSFYRKTYTAIGLVIAIVGVVIIPFLKYLINDINSINDVYLIYILYLINTVSTYFISYKETLINADQKKYKLAGIEFVGLVVLNVLQMIFLILTRNFIVYLVIQFFTLFVQRIIINKYITKTYENIDFHCKEKIEKKDLQIIIKNVKAMFFHKIGDYCINSTDNLIISSFINVATVGIYSNYLTVINLLNNFILIIYNGIGASLGNLVATESNEKKEDIFKKMNFIAFCIYGVCSVCLINLFNDFIKIWIGEKYCLGFYVVLVIGINFYLTGMRVPASTMKSSAGLFDVDKYTPIIQSIINLVVSIILVKKMGLIGVLIGTFISSITIPCWQRPYLIYKYVLKRSSVRYFIEYFKYILILIICTILSVFINSFIDLNNMYIQFVLKGIITVIIFMTIVFFVYRKSGEFKYIINTVKKIIKRRKNAKGFN